MSHDERSAASASAESAGTSPIPDAIAECGRCGEMFFTGGGKVTVERFTLHEAQECGAPRLCEDCYLPLYEMVARYLGFGVGAVEGWGGE